LRIILPSACDIYEDETQETEAVDLVDSFLKGGYTGFTGDSDDPIYLFITGIIWNIYIIIYI